MTLGGNELSCILEKIVPTTIQIDSQSRHERNEQMMKDTSSLIILDLESLLHYSTRLDMGLPCSNGWASQLRRLWLVRNNWEGIPNQWSQEVAIKRVPRPNWTITGCSNLMTDRPSVESSWGLAIPHHKPVQARKCAVTEPCSRARDWILIKALETLND